MSLPGTWALIGPDGKQRRSRVPGTLGGHRGSRIYGRFDCRTALLAIARGGYVKHRVFFLDEATAIAAGYRPCGVCLPEKHAAWKGLRDLAAIAQHDVAHFEEPVEKTGATVAMNAMSRDVGITADKVTPIAFRDGPLLNAAGVHEPSYTGKTPRVGSLQG